MPRADILLVDRGLARSRSQAQRWIAGGLVSYRQNGVWLALSKPGQRLDDATELQLAAAGIDRYVSRGGVKLEAALARAALDIRGWKAIDIGASTGGFSDCLLQAGVSQVVCVDVGHDQLAPSLREDPRVINYEGINARELPASLLEHAPEGFDIAVMDVSFISQTLILPAVVPLLRDGGWLLSLVKPQFEVGREGIGKGGIVRDEALYAEVEKRIREACLKCGFEVREYFESPITGGDGNREFLLVARGVGSRKSDAKPKT